MSIEHHFCRDIPVIDLSVGIAGRICVDIDNFIAELKKLARSSPGIISLNMSSRDFLNSSGLADLIKARDRLFDEGIEIVLINPTEKVKSLLAIIGVEEFFRIFDDENELKKAE